MHDAWLLTQDVLDLRSQVTSLSKGLKPVERAERVQSLLETKAQLWEDLEEVRASVFNRAGVSSN